MVRRGAKYPDMGKQLKMCAPHRCTQPLRQDMIDECTKLATSHDGDKKAKGNM
jgi:hypothetical protein